MTTLRDLWIIRQARKRGWIKEEELRSILHLISEKELSLRSFILKNNHLSHKEWKICEKDAQSREGWPESRRQVSRDNTIIYETLKGQKDIEKTKMKEAYQLCEDLYNPTRALRLDEILVKKRILGDSTTVDLLQVQTDVGLTCPQCNYRIILERYYPWWQVPCVLGDHYLFPLPKNSKDHPLEEKLKDRYKVGEMLGKGGMGEVYRAFDREFQREVALKIIATDKSRNPELVRRFANEVRLLAQLNHPVIVPVYEYGETEDFHYFTMAYVEGQDLRDWIEERGKLASKEALELMIPLVEAVSYAHEQGVIHRDIKPENIMIDPEGRVLLMDFGLARQLETENTRITQTGVILGSPEFMAPEQAQGNTKVGETVDIYALGGTLYFLLAGRPPFQARDFMALMNQVVSEVPPPLSQFHGEVDPQIEKIALKCLAKSKEERYPSVQALYRDLQAARGNRPLPDSSGEGKKKNQKAFLLLFVAFFSVALLGAVGYFAYFKDDSPLKSDREVSLSLHFRNFIEEKKDVSSEAFGRLVKEAKRREIAEVIGLLESRQRKVRDLARRVLPHLEDYGGEEKRKSLEKAIFQEVKKLKAGEEELKEWKEILQQLPASVGVELLRDIAYWEESNGYYQRCQWWQAAEKLEKLLANRPQWHRARLLLAWTLYYRLKLDRLKRRLENLRKELASHPSFQALQGAYYYQSLDFKKAKIYFDQLRDKNWTSPDFELVLGEYYYYVQGDWEKALARFEKGCQLAPLRSDLQAERLTCYRWKRNIHWLFKECNRVIEKCSPSFNLYWHKVFLLKGRGEREKVVEVFKKVEKLLEEKWKRSQTPRLFRRRLIIMFKLKKWGKAREICREKLKARRGIYRAYAHRALGELHQKEGNLSSAASRFKVALEILKTKVPPTMESRRALWSIKYDLAKCYYYLKRFELALKTFEDLREESTVAHSCYYWEGMALVRLGQTEKGLERLEEGLERYPGQYGLALKLANLYSQLGRGEKWEKLTRNASQRFFESWEGYRMELEYHTQNKDWKKVEPLASEGIEKYPSRNVVFYFYRAVACYHLARNEPHRLSHYRARAVRDLEKVVRKASNPRQRKEAQKWIKIVKSLR